MIHYATQPDAALRDSLALERARDEVSFSAACAEIEARHAVEGVGEMDRAAYEALKRQHAMRIARVMLA